MELCNVNNIVLWCDQIALGLNLHLNNNNNNNNNDDDDDDNNNNNNNNNNT
jgi:hypothetical protein